MNEIPESVRKELAMIEVYLKNAQDNIRRIRAIMDKNQETGECCANCRNYCEGSGKMTTCLNAHYEYECHEPGYVCERWEAKE